MAERTNDAAIRQGSGKFTDQQPFVVTKDDLANRHWGGGRGAAGLACGFCDRIPEAGEVWRWVYVEGRPNTFVCQADDSHPDLDEPDVAERFKERWDTVIKPILRRWGDG